MNNHWSRCLFLIFIFFACQAFGQASYYEQGQSYFTKRYENAKGLIAPSKNINMAIKFFKKDKSPKSITGLLRAYEFKGSYTKQAKMIRKKIYSRAIKLGKKSLNEYPDEISIKYYYMANLGRWGQTISIIKAHEKGVLDEVKLLTEDIIQSNTYYDEAGAQRILGAIHLKAPNIPFILTWPSEDTALELLEAAFTAAPNNLGNGRLYAEALIEHGDDSKAKKLLEDLINRTPRENHLLEDLKNIEESKVVYEDNFQ